MQLNTYELVKLNTGLSRDLPQSSETDADDGARLLDGNREGGRVALVARSARLLLLWRREVRADAALLPARSTITITASTIAIAEVRTEAATDRRPGRNHLCREAVRYRSLGGRDLRSRLRERAEHFNESDARQLYVLPRPPNANCPPLLLAWDRVERLRHQRYLHSVIRLHSGSY